MMSVGCGGRARESVAAGFGPKPVLPSPRKSLIPTMHIAPAKGWPAGELPAPASDLAVNAFAGGLDHPRWLLALPNGDVLVAETNAPPKPDDAKGIRGWFMKRLMKKAGAAVPSANRITLLRDVDGDGFAEFRRVFLKDLNSPFGMALVDSTLYVANSDAVMRFPYRDGDTVITQPGIKVVDLPAGPINHHWTKNLIASRDGSRLAENGMDKEVNRASILEVDPASGRFTVFASGLRNPNGLGWEPVSGALWTVVNERDELGSDLVPDYMTSVTPGGFYGWPYSYYGGHVDTRVKPQRPEMVAKALVPDYALGAHTASLGLCFYQTGLLPQRFVGGVFIGQHGSWNRKPLSGYHVIFVPFANGRPSGSADTVLTGFVDKDGKARGRPVGLAIDRAGALLVADDVGNTVWRVVGKTLKP